MNIKLAETDAEIERCFPVMRQLRKRLSKEEFLERVKRQSRNENYLLAYVEDSNEVKAAAGFRITEMLCCGRFLYVDDLVTDPAERSKKYGGTLFDWLADYAKSMGCDQLRLDSGVQRADAHRFYFRKRMHISDYNFVLKLNV